MRMSQDEKDRSRQRILDSAARLVRERGIAGTSVADVMQAAGMTHGGFYKHFDSKESLIAAAVGGVIDGVVASLGTDDPAEAYARYRTQYLSGFHRDNPAIGCPIAALASEIGRGDGPPREVMGRGVRQMVEAITAAMPGEAGDARTAALRDLSMLVGAILIARASDDTTAAAVLGAAQQGVRHGH